MCIVIYQEKEETIYAKLFQPHEEGRPWIGFIPLGPVYLEMKDYGGHKTVKNLLWSQGVMLWFLQYEKNFHERHCMTDLSI